MSDSTRETTKSGIILADLPDLSKTTNLQEYDSDQNGVVEYEETLGKDIVLAEQQAAYAVLNEGDFDLLKRVIYSQNNTGHIGKKLNADEVFFINTNQPSAEDWVLRDSQKIRSNKPLRAWLDLTLLDYSYDQETYSFLFNYKPKSEADGFYFLLHINDNPNEATLQFGGSFYALNNRSKDETLENWRAHFLQGLYVMFIKPLEDLPKQLQDQNRDRFEARMLEAQPDLYVAKYTLKSRDDVEEDEQDHYDQIKNNEIPAGVTPLFLQGSDEPLEASWYSESVLTEANQAKFMTAYSMVPPEINEVMAAKGILSNLVIQVIDDDSIDLLVNGSVPAFYDVVDGVPIVRIRRSFILQNGDYRISVSLTHEDGHVIMPEGPQYFLFKYYQDKLKELSGTYNPFISQYFRTFKEAFCDTVVGFLKGEEDLNPIAEWPKGPMDRAEVREKMPEMYLALCLYFGHTAVKENSYFANDVVFEKDSLKVYSKIIKKYPDLLQAEASLDELITVYEKELKKIRKKQ